MNQGDRIAHSAWARNLADIAGAVVCAIKLEELLLLFLKNLRTACLVCVEFDVLLSKPRERGNTNISRPNRVTS